MKKLVVTGGSGFFGPYVIKEFLRHGYAVVNADQRLPCEPLCKTVLVDLQHLGEAHSVLVGAAALVHLAAISVPYRHTNATTFKNNVMSTYNVLEAAANLGVRKVVLASSDASYGLAFATDSLAPRYVPLDEEHPQRPQDSYGLSKVVGEQTAEAFHSLAGIQVVSLRFCWIVSPEMYQDFPTITKDIARRKRTLWSYVDARDAATACHLAAEADNLGAVALNIAADDSIMTIKSHALMAAEYPEVNDFRTPLMNHESLTSNTKAKRALLWQPLHSWRHHVPALR